MSNSKLGPKSSETSENVEEETELLNVEEDKPNDGIKENGKQSSQSESKKAKSEKFPSKPSNGELKKRVKMKFPSKEEISKSR